MRTMQRDPARRKKNAATTLGARACESSPCMNCEVGRGEERGASVAGALLLLLKRRLARARRTS